MSLRPGKFKARGIKGSEKFFATEGKSPQLSVQLDIPELDDTVTVYLPFSPAAAPYSFDKLKALGWKGTGPQDLGELDNIHANEVDILVKEEMYNGKKQLRVDIWAGDQKSKTVDRSQFVSKVSSLVGAQNGTTTPVGEDDIPF